MICHRTDSEIGIQSTDLHYGHNILTTESPTTAFTMEETTNSQYSINILAKSKLKTGLIW